MIFTRDFATRENHWQITPLVTKKSLFTVTHALFFIYFITAEVLLFYYLRFLEDSLAFLVSGALPTGLSPWTQTRWLFRWQYWWKARVQIWHVCFRSFRWTPAMCLFRVCARVKSRPQQWHRYTTLPYNGKTGSGSHNKAIDSSASDICSSSIKICNFQTLCCEWCL